MRALLAIFSFILVVGCLAIILIGAKIIVFLWNWAKEGSKDGA